MELVRSTKRLADALRAPWTAVYIETPRAQTFSDEQRAQLAAAMQLAAQLGGNVANVPAANVIDGLKTFALEARATQLVVGKSSRSRWFELRHGSVVDRLVRETPGIASNRGASESSTLEPPAAAAIAPTSVMPSCTTASEPSMRFFIRRAVAAPRRRTAATTPPPT